MSVIDYPLVTEKTTRLMEETNTLTLVVNIDSNKGQIKDAVKETYEVEVEKINTMITSEGKKKAMVKLSPEYDAEEIASRLGIF